MHKACNHLNYMINSIRNYLFWEMTASKVTLFNTKVTIIVITGEHYYYRNGNEAGLIGGYLSKQWFSEDRKNDGERDGYMRVAFKRLNSGSRSKSVLNASVQESVSIISSAVSVPNLFS